MGPSRRERREQLRWQQDAIRRLEELDRIDREQGLGAMPYGTAANDTGRHQPRRRRRSTGPVLPGLLISAVLAGAVMLNDPGMTGYRFGQVVDHLTGNDDGAYAFVATTSGDPVGWDHCEPIHYLVNPEGAPERWTEVVRDAVTMVTEASDFDFEYDGTSTERSTDRRSVSSDDPPPVLVVWSDAGEVRDLEGTTAGIGGSTPARVRGRVRFVTGMVVLDTEAFDRMSRGGDLRSQVLILAHELGHVLGLDHVEDVDELMNAEYVGQSGFGDGDRQGLAQLREIPCS